MITETITVEVKPEHLERAKKIANKHSKDYCRKCVIAEACKGKVRRFSHVGTDRIYQHRPKAQWMLCGAGYGMVIDFDNGNYDEIHLPQTITLTRCE